MDKAREIYEQWKAKREQIEREAKANGTWKKIGLDSNNHLFKDVDKMAQEQLKALKDMSHR